MSKEHWEILIEAIVGSLPDSMALRKRRLVALRTVLPKQHDLWPAVDELLRCLDLHEIAQREFRFTAESRSNP